MERFELLNLKKEYNELIKIGAEIKGIENFYFEVPMPNIYGNKETDFLIGSKNGIQCLKIKNNEYKIHLNLDYTNLENFKKSIIENKKFLEISKDCDLRELYIETLILEDLLNVLENL